MANAWIPPGDNMAHWASLFYSDEFRYIPMVSDVMAAFWVSHSRWITFSAAVFLLSSDWLRSHRTECCPQRRLLLSFGAGGFWLCLPALWLLTPAGLHAVVQVLNLKGMNWGTTSPFTSPKHCTEEEQQLTEALWQRNLLFDSDSFWARMCTERC